ncbi:MAG: trypsin-like serine peptidase, partial [Gammaproteobacteria bacterium]
LTHLPTIINGYPGDKPLTQWKSTDQVRVTQARKIFYLNDTVGGMSGSPVYYNRPAGSAFCSGNCSMAIHTNGLHGASPHSVYNHGTRIVQPVFDNLFNWKNAP